MCHDAGTQRPFLVLDEKIQSSNAFIRAPPVTVDLCQHVLTLQGTRVVFPDQSVLALQNFFSDPPGLLVGALFDKPARKCVHRIDTADVVLGQHFLEIFHKPPIDVYSLCPLTLAMVNTGKQHQSLHGQWILVSEDFSELCQRP